MPFGLVILRRLIKVRRRLRSQFFGIDHGPVKLANQNTTSDRHMPTIILLIRHGETDWNRAKVFRGRHDVPLNDNGRTQAGLVAEALRCREIDAAYTSPLSRATETACITLDPHRLVAVAEPAFTDFDYGEWTGHAETDVAVKWPEELEQWQTIPQCAQPPGGDTLQDVYNRAFNTLEGLAASCHGQTVAVFAHRVVNKLLALGVLGLGLERFPFMMQGNCCINEFERTDNGWLIHCLNDTAHMRSDRVDMLKEDF
jgi:broad specificity phosphatase PhoE